MIHKPKSENYKITTSRTWSESRFHWKNQFHKNPPYFRIFADLEADIEIDNSSVCKKTTNIYKKNIVCTG